ncbi:MAG: YabP/YqfC family sporulation protein [Oscillospiraceae bacterium]|nr:YabP/YqfC family sporulation protein [Oscillospiraceae bacterium]
MNEDKSSIHIAGNYEILLENCRRIEEYNEVFIKVKTKKLYIEVWGNQLRAFDFKTDSLIIRGKISRIELIEKGDKA